MLVTDVIDIFVEDVVLQHQLAPRGRHDDWYAAPKQTQIHSLLRVQKFMDGKVSTDWEQRSIVWNYKGVGALDKGNYLGLKCDALSRPQGWCSRQSQQPRYKADWTAINILEGIVHGLIRQVLPIDNS